MIPIVYGYVSYTDFIPHHSFIDVRYYKSQADLARHLHEVSSNKALFDSYMAWKKDNMVLLDTFLESTCDLCDYLH